MYHPNEMLRIAHQREAELIRDAQICGVPQAEPNRARIPAELVPILVAVTIVASAIALLIA